MKIRRRVVAVIRREVKRLATIAADRAVQAQSVRAAPNFRPLTEGETAAILGDALLAKLTRYWPDRGPENGTRRALARLGR